MPRPPLLVLFLFSLSAVLLVIFGMLVFRGDGRQPTAPAPLPETRNAPEVTVVDPVRGSTAADASTIVVFGDYQCEYCRQLETTLAEIEVRRPDVRIAWKNLPLRLEHPQAQLAAEAALCAGRQGRHWEMHDLLMGIALPTTAELAVPLAEEIGIDAEVFRTCLATGATRPLVDRTVEEALALGVDGVPYLFVGSQRFSGFVEPAAILAALEAQR